MDQMFVVTDEKDQTEGEIQWGVGIRHVAKGRDRDLQNSAFIVGYGNQYMAGLLNPSLPDSPRRVLWHAQGEGKHKRDGQYQCDYERVTTVAVIDMPTFTPTQYVAFGIYCGQSIYSARGWNEWANGWLGGTDRSAEAAMDALAGELGSVTARLHRNSAAAVMSVCEAAAALATGSTPKVIIGALSAAGMAMAVKSNIDLGALAERAYGFH
jgi:hypothetical protein